MALATLDDLIGTGHLAIGTGEDDPSGVRATTLLELATGLVLTYCRTEEADVADWAAASQLAITTVVAEVAGRRLTSPGAETAEQLGDQPGYLRLRLTKADKGDLDEIPEVAAARTLARPTSLVLTRPNSWANTIGVSDQDSFE